jgi:hypothetical protein
MRRKISESCIIAIVAGVLSIVAADWCQFPDAPMAIELLYIYRRLPVMLSTQLLDCKNLMPGSLIDVETKSRHYRIEYLGGNSIRVSGHPEFCPDPVMASLQGSLDQDGCLEWGFIVCGMKLIFVLAGDRPVTTSSVVHVNVEQPNLIQ